MHYYPSEEGTRYVNYGPIFEYDKTPDWINGTTAAAVTLTLGVTAISKQTSEADAMRAEMVAYAENQQEAIIGRLTLYHDLDDYVNNPQTQFRLKATISDGTATTNPDPNQEARNVSFNKRFNTLVTHPSYKPLTDQVLDGGNHQAINEQLQQYATWDNDRLTYWTQQEAAAQAIGGVDVLTVVGVAGYTLLSLLLGYKASRRIRYSSREKRSQRDIIQGAEDLLRQEAADSQ